MGSVSDIKHAASVVEDPDDIGQKESDGCRRNAADSSEHLCEEKLKTEAVMVTRSSVRGVQKVISDEVTVQRRSSPRFENLPKDKRPYYGLSRKRSLHGLENNSDSEGCECSENPQTDRVNNSEQQCKRRKIIRTDNLGSKTIPGGNKDEALVPVNSECGSKENTRFGEKEENGKDIDRSTFVAGISAHARVKETLRIFNSHYLRCVQEEENRCKVEVRKVSGSKSKKQDVGDDSKQSSKRSSKRPDLKAISKMLASNEVLYRRKIIGHLPGIDVGHQFFSRAEMVAVGFHSHWLNGIDFIAESCKKMEEYSGYTLPLVVAIVLSGQYEDDLDNLEEVVYTGQGGNDLLGNKRQVQDQVMLRGNLGLKHNMEQSVPVRVVRGHNSEDSYCRKVYTYDGLYKVVDYWAQKGVSEFTVFKFRLRRLDGQPALSTNQVVFTRRGAYRATSEIPGLVCEDISIGQEDIQVPATNECDNPPIAPEGFRYMNAIEVAEGLRIPPNALGCNCKGKCTNPKTCSCARLNGTDFPYVFCNGRRLINAKDVVYECGPNCGCGPDCLNRTSQMGLQFRLEVYRTPKKGWAVRSWDVIPSGAAVCEYIGLLRKTSELDNISGNDFIFEIDCLHTMNGIGGREKRSLGVSVPTNNHLKTIDDSVTEGVPEFCIDAGSAGNVSRFINHSCEPNLFVQCVLSSHHDLRLARVVLFAANNIPAFQELTYDYGYVLDSVVGSDGKIKQMPCHCGAAGCRGRLY